MNDRDKWRERGRVNSSLSEWLDDDTSCKIQCLIMQGNNSRSMQIIFRLVESFIIQILMYKTIKTDPTIFYTVLSFKECIQNYDLDKSTLRKKPPSQISKRLVWFLHFMAYLPSWVIYCQSQLRTEVVLFDLQLWG